MSSGLLDRELLWRYVREGSEESFRLLVDRHVDLVFGAAVRRLNNRSAAEEVTQIVFVLLARRAAFLTGHPSLAGWLYHAARNQAQQQFRSEQRRLAREATANHLAPAMHANSPSPLIPVLDEVLLELCAADREILMLRYLEDKSLREVGAQLGLQEDAARKRVAKALDALTKRFERRGYKVAGAAVTAAALRAMVQTAPAGLAALAGTGALEAGAASSAMGLIVLLARFMALGKVQVGVVCLALGLGPMAWEAKPILAAKLEQQQLRIRLEQARAGLADDEQEQAQLQRQLAAAGRSLDRVQGQLARRKVLAKLVPDGQDANLYRWSDASEYVRLPKPLLKRIGLPDPEIGSSGIVKRGKVSQLLLQTMGLGESQIAVVGQAVAETTAAFSELERSHSSLTNQLPDGTTTGEFPALIIQPFQAEAEALRERLKNRLGTVMDSEQAEVFWSQLGGTFIDDGSRERIRILERLAGHDMPFIEEYDEGHMTHGVQVEDLPEPLKPFAASWKTNATH